MIFAFCRLGESSLIYVLCVDVVCVGKYETPLINILFARYHLYVSTASLAVSYSCFVKKGDARAPVNEFFKIGILYYYY